MTHTRPMRLVVSEGDNEAELVRALQSVAKRPFLVQVSRLDKGGERNIGSALYDESGTLVAETGTKA
ncbi:hypothetical protein LCGC14_2686110 [marine sediment metagenome]|uniref:Uncharacterized protein n=1 Tax=marine sediment metagenome TaxID=412755 RepID=A0A0F8ZJX7_9ZZZZ